MAEQLTRALRTKQEGLPLVDERQTVANYLDRWLRDVAARLRPRTLVSYKQVVNAHIVPNLGRVRLARLTPQHVQSWLNDVQRPGDEEERSPLSPRTRALRWGLVDCIS